MEDPWIKCDDLLPPKETPVLIFMQGEIRIGELRTENPGHEDTHEPFDYWDDPHDDGQIWEHADITHWKPLPESPK